MKFDGYGILHSSFQPWYYHTARQKHGKCAQYWCYLELIQRRGTWERESFLENNTLCKFTLFYHLATLGQCSFDVYTNSKVTLFKAML